MAFMATGSQAKYPAILAVQYSCQMPDTNGRVKTRMKE